MGDIKGVHSAPGVYTRITPLQKKNNSESLNLTRTTVSKGSLSSNGSSNSGNGGGGYVPNDKIYMFIDGSNYKGDLSLVNSSISNIQWNIKKQDNTLVASSEDSPSITVEYGAKVDYHGEWKYANKGENEKLPTSCSGSWGSELPGPEVLVPFEANDITTSKTFSQTISAPKGGLIVKDNKVVVADQTELDTLTVSNTVTFKHLMYFGSSDKINLNDLSDLQSLGGNEFIANLNSNKEVKNIVCSNNYAYIAWPSTLGEKTWNVGGLDIQPIEETVTITNQYGENIEYIITRSENTLNSTINVILKS
jgi:hypothetical protein